MARLDEDGYIYIVDRKKDMALRGGENIYCAEVESAVFAHPAVAECTAFGVPDDRLGEEVGAAVFPNAGATISADALRAHCAAPHREAQDPSLRLDPGRTAAPQRQRQVPETRTAREAGDRPDAH